jgi:hypothetical protein
MGECHEPNGAMAGSAAGLVRDAPFENTANNMGSFISICFMMVTSPKDTAGLMSIASRQRMPAEIERGERTEPRR